jgi:hypothetical protein
MLVTVIRVNTSVNIAGLHGIVSRKDGKYTGSKMKMIIQFFADLPADLTAQRLVIKQASAKETQTEERYVTTLL